MELYSRFLANTGRPIHKNLHYFPAYERHFGRYVGRPLTMIEIGAGGGGSGQMWKAYFGPLARIVSLDVRPECKEFEDEQVSVRIGDQSDESFLAAVLQEFGSPDIVLDDGSHLMKHVSASFVYLYPRMVTSGTYMIEDLHTAYWQDYGGGLGQPGSFIELSKRMIDELNADLSRGAVEPTEFTRRTISMHFYDSIAVFERGITPSKRSVVTGDKSLPYG